MPKVYTAQFSDTAGPTNPTGIWSPTFLALKQALDRGDTPENVVQALYDWLSQKKIPPQHVDRILELEPAAAYDALLGLVDAKFKPKGLPALVQSTLKQALRLIVRRHVQGREQVLAKEQERLNGLKTRYGVESAPQVVRRLLGS